ncbi:uncharacterized protein LOC128725701 [Anopheles nili]|uniref:uncharacterized protein LOC128725701 n=1 Tax=Anopheles nili TaxID=185578 RepID=UPI00237B21F6|nr:uncharacterized protein LOC128725701 [Anopheles nili]
MIQEAEFSEQSSVKAELGNNVENPDYGGDGSALKSKKELRRERKKRKLLALSAVMILNEQEGIGRHGSNKTSANSECAPVDTNNSQVEKGELKKILANNRTAFDIGEGNVTGAENPVVEPKRRKEDVCNASVEGIPRNNGNVQDTDIEYRTLKAYVNQAKTMRYTPRIVLKPIGQKALLERKPQEERIPLLLDDIQAMLMNTLLRMDSPTAPRWVNIEKISKLTHTVVLIVEGFSCENYVTYREHMPACSTNIFGPMHTLQIVCPSVKLFEEIACVPLSDTHKDILVAEYGSLEAAMKICKDQTLVRKSIFSNIDAARSLDNQPDYSDLKLPGNDKFPRTLLLLSPIQMINEGFPLPLAGTLQNRYKDYLTTSDHYKPVTPHSPMFGVDCEMCGIAGNKSVLTRVSIVNEAGNIVYNELVKPLQKIIDYRTRFSGITEQMLKNVTKRLKDVQRDLRALLPPDAILVGHSLNSDLDAMEMLHPYVIDTSIVYNISGNQSHKQKLRILAKKFLHKDIQCGTDGHDSIEDCVTSLELVKLKLTHSIYFGDQWLQDRRNNHALLSSSPIGIAQATETAPSELVGNANKARNITTTLFSHAKKRNKRSAIVTNAAEDLKCFAAYFGDAVQHKQEAAASKDWLSYSMTTSLDETIRNTAENCLQYDFNIAYAKLPRDPPEGDNNSDKTALAKQINEWVQSLHHALSINGLLVVLLVGAEGTKQSTGNRIGVVMLQTKKLTNG